MTTNPPLQKILQGILHTEHEGKQNHEGQEVPNHRRRKDKKEESNTDLTSHTIKPLNNKDN
jgi:hypothetical protein